MRFNFLEKLRLKEQEYDKPWRCESYWRRNNQKIINHRFEIITPKMKEYWQVGEVGRMCCRYCGISGENEIEL